MAARTCSFVMEDIYFTSATFFSPAGALVATTGLTLTAQGN